MNTKNPQRLQRKIKELHQNWELLGDVLARLNRERILETRVDEKMRLEQKIADIEAERQQVEQQLDELEAQIGTDDTREDVAGRKPEPHSEPPQSPEIPSGQHKKKQPRKTPKPQKAEETPVIHLRSESLTVSEEEAQKVFGLDEEWRPLEYIQNDYEAQGEVVIDHATRLMWQKAGSARSLTYKEAQKYVKELNRQKFADYDDWRLPTSPELMSLLEPKEQSNDLYINPIFGSMEIWGSPDVIYWSADRLPKEIRSTGDAWSVDFSSGHVRELGITCRLSSVRCVRSIK